jgi:hypothetical protein
MMMQVKVPGNRPRQNQSKKNVSCCKQWEFAVFCLQLSLHNNSKHLSELEILQRMKEKGQVRKKPNICNINPNLSSLSQKPRDEESFGSCKSLI